VPPDVAGPVITTWKALQHSAEYLLIYGHTGGAARRVNERVAMAMSNAVGVLYASMRLCAGHGDIDVPRLEEATPPPLRDQFAACMLTYSRLHGAIVLELAGHVPSQLTDHDALFNLQMEHTTDSLHPLSWAPSPARRR
jgi:hypothetical protein